MILPGNSPAYIPPVMLTKHYNSLGGDNPGERQVRHPEITSCSEETIPMESDLLSTHQGTT